MRRVGAGLDAGDGQHERGDGDAEALDEFAEQRGRGEEQPFGAPAGVQFRLFDQVAIIEPARIWKAMISPTSMTVAASTNQ